MSPVVDIKSMTPEELAVWLKSTYLNTLLQGRAVFRETEKGGG